MYKCTNMKWTNSQKINSWTFLSLKASEKMLLIAGPSRKRHISTSSDSENEKKKQKRSKIRGQRSPVMKPRLLFKACKALYHHQVITFELCRWDTSPNAPVEESSLTHRIFFPTTCLQTLRCVLTPQLPRCLRSTPALANGRPSWMAMGTWVTFWKLLKLLQREVTCASSSAQRWRRSLR